MNVREAMALVPRELFVPESERVRALDDSALPIGWGQTISQPTMVALICELLELDGDERVLDVGTGSGYQAAVLAHLAREVHSIERIPQLAARARATLHDGGHDVQVHVGDGSLGDPAHAPFDAIAVAAGAPEPPPALVEQLAPGGRLVIPLGDRVDQQLVQLVREESGVRIERSVPCRFVPLVGEQGW